MARRYGKARLLAAAVDGKAHVVSGPRHTRSAVILARDVELRRALASRLRDCFVPYFADTAEGAAALATRLPHTDLIIVDAELAESIGPLVLTWPEAICVLMCAGPGCSSQLHTFGCAVHLIIARPPTRATIRAINCAVLSLGDG